MSDLSIKQSASNAIIQSMDGDDIARLWRSVRKGGDEECWEWIGAKFGNSSYGMISIKTKAILVHRAAWFATHGSLPPKDRPLVCHTCDNRLCCNPRHFFAGTYFDNNHDRSTKGRTARGRRSGPAKYPERMPRGVANKNSKLTDELVRKIRADHANGGSYNGIAKALGLNSRTIKLAIRRETWAHVA